MVVPMWLAGTRAPTGGSGRQYVSLFLREVREAEAEYTTRPAREYEDVEALIADLGLAE